MEDWHTSAIKLAETKVLSWRSIAKSLGVSKSTVSDFLRGYFKWREEGVAYEVEENLKPSDLFTIQTSKDIGGKTHLYIPDSQVRKGVSLDFLEWIGKYIVRKQPEVIVHAGDFADMESLSSYDKGKRTAEGKRVNEDIEVAIEAMKVLLKPLYDLQQSQLKEHGKVLYKPRMVMTLGNHEGRIDRHVNANPELHGFLSTDSLRYKDFGWEVYPFLTPVIIDNIAYSHYFPNVMTGKPLGGSVANMLKTIGTSFTMGHKQTLDVATRFLPANGVQQWGLIAGAGYTHDEDYKGVQGNRHWRGIVVKHNVKDGSYDPLFISLDWLKREYGS